jgi:hypothetical protein
MERVDFRFSKDWGSIKKGTVKRGLRRSQARSLQDIRKVGKIVKPKEDKADPDVKARATK